jgi:hypothetical protein
MILISHYVQKLSENWIPSLPCPIYYKHLRLLSFAPDYAGVAYLNALAGLWISAKNTTGTGSYFTGLIAEAIASFNVGSFEIRPQQIAYRMGLRAEIMPDYVAAKS